MLLLRFYGGVVINREIIQALEENLCQPLAKLPSRLADAQSDYLHSGDLQRALIASFSAVQPVLTYCSYILGHADGVAAEHLQNIAPRANELLQAAHVEYLVAELVHVLRQMWSSYGSWPDMTIYWRLMEVVARWLRFSGIQQTTSGLWVLVSQPQRTIPKNP